MSSTDSATSNQRQLLWSVVLLGIGVMAAVDEIVFHQLLHWHHFYDRSTSDMALFSDGMLHAAELVLIVAGFFLFLDAARSGPVPRRFAWGGFLVGAGGFQVFDGIVDHKLIRAHQIRYDVEILTYDLAWDGAGVMLLLCGLYLLRGAARGTAPQTASPQGK